MWSVLPQLAVAVVLGAVLGAQREVVHKAAGIRTYALVTLGSCLFTLLSTTIGQGNVAFDPSRIASQVVIGVGFLGAGLIFLRGEHVEGLTTAAGLWVAAAIGMAVGVRAYGAAIVTTAIVLVLFAFVKLRLEDHWWNRRREPPPSDVST